jgi:hypothetical protein
MRSCSYHRPDFGFACRGTIKSYKEMVLNLKAKAGQLIAELQKRRDEFRAVVQTEAEVGEAAFARMKPQLESSWNDFEAQLKTYIETVGKQAEQRQATFREVAAAQISAWRKAPDKFHEAAKVAAARRSDIDAVVTQMKADASEVEAQLRKLHQKGSESWTALGAALAESRNAFDHANQTAWEALKRAAPPMT